MSTLRIAVTGYNGRLGHELVKRGCIPFKADITNIAQIRGEITEIKPDIIINCAAYTDVSGCENNVGYDKAILTNYFGAKNLRMIFPKLIVQISTDYVFDGKKGAYSENSKLTTAVNGYGLTKQGAEIMFQSFPFPYSIVRTTCLYDTYIQEDLVRSVMDDLNMSVGETSAVTTKLSGNPTYVPHLAEGIMKLIELPNIPEIIHIAGREVMTRYEFALMIAAVFGYDKEHIIPTNKLFGAGNRPAKGGLKVKLAEKLGLPIYSVLEGLQQYKKDLEDESLS